MTVSTGYWKGSEIGLIALERVGKLRKDRVHVTISPFGGLKGVREVQFYS